LAVVVQAIQTDKIHLLLAHLLLKTHRVQARIHLRHTAVVLAQEAEHLQEVLGGREAVLVE